MTTRAGRSSTNDDGEREMEGRGEERYDRGAGTVVLTFSTKRAD